MFKACKLLDGRMDDEDDEDDEDEPGIMPPNSNVGTDDCDEQGFLPQDFESDQVWYQKIENFKYSSTLSTKTDKFQIES